MIRRDGRRAARLVPLGIQGAADAFRLLRVAAVDLNVRVGVRLAHEVAVVQALAVLDRHF